MAQGQLFILSAPSGTGKTTLIRRLLNELDDLGYSISYTTRPPRSQEKDGIDYHFLSREQFAQLEKQGAFLESAEIFGERYGTPRALVLQELDRGHDVLLDLDEQGAASAKHEMPAAVLILLLPPSGEALRERLRERGDNEAAVTKRLKEAHATLSKHEMYDYLLVNSDLDECVSKLKTIIFAERCRSRRYQGLIAELCQSLL